MIFVPHIIRCADNISIPVDISSASADDIVATYGSPSWQTEHRAKRATGTGL